MNDGRSNNVNTDETQDEPVSKELGFGVRHIQILLMFLCLTTAFGMRVTMSVAIVAMTDHETSPHPDIPVFDWDKKIQGIMLSSFFWGYLSTQIPGSYIAHKYGAKLLLTWVMIGNGCMAILTPFAAQYAGWKLVCACRAVQGITQGSTIPCLHSLQGKWSPVNERGRLSTYIYGGTNCGTILAMAVSGLLAATTYGWPIIFYSSGALSIVIGIIWAIFGADSPATHPSISEKERDYIQTSLGQQGASKPMKIPWVQILSNLPTWATAVAHVGFTWISMTLFTEMPTYLSKTMEVNIKTNGLLSALPFVGMWIFSFLVSNISDRLINKGYISLIHARKLANTIGTCGAACGLVMLSFVPAKQILVAVILLTLTVSIKATMLVGFHVNHIDISPNFSGTLMGIGNCLSQCFGTMAPITAGLIISDEKDLSQWRTVFFISAGIVFVTNLFYIIFGSAEKADWNELDYFEKRKELQANQQDTELQALNIKTTLLIPREKRNIKLGTNQIDVEKLY